MKECHEMLIQALMEHVENYPEKAEEILEKAKDKDFLSKVTDDIADEIKGTIISYVSDELVERRKENTKFLENNYRKWDDGFDSLESLILICIDAGNTCNKMYGAEFVKQKDFLFGTIVRLHARACHIANEILCLLKSGYADGAHARWRALHEVAVTSSFITANGQECAKRYLDHDVIESYKGMLQQKKFESRLNAEGPTQGEIDSCKKVYDEIVAEYGKEFKGQYGWASKFVSKKGRVNFADIEQSVGSDHFRPYYKWASQNIHAGPKALRNQLGMCESEKDVLLVGPSDSGMTDPASSTALSLVNITTNLLLIKPTLDHIAIMKILAELAENVGDIFFKIDFPELDKNMN
ncbi:DUF5677 domain-containing protein [Desulfovibrio sp. JC010]|uniref:DUF5677 domain-containing protein n=1 Tax=Desulfovibrio sp. JC010 TaxID=2593641 RepID=UPI0013D47436|nr:DUF5677 domain-containing protein [Desulfovibrio sp. JC010]NDV28675.1 hypothetical protein [Desulfovibrio sp. JC010]